jgi:hypothetical protein
VYATEEDAFQRLLEGAVAINGEGAVTQEAARIISERGIRRYTFWERREGKSNGEGAVTEETARIIKERGIRRYTF